MYCGPGKLTGATVRCIPAVVNNFHVAVGLNRPQLGLLENRVSAGRRRADLLRTPPPFSCASSASIIGRVSHPAEAGLLRKGTGSLGLLETRSRQVPSQSRKTCAIAYSIEEWNFLYSRKSRKVSSALESSSPPIAAAHNPVRRPFVETELS
jgi:hypothetical protein